MHGELFVDQERGRLCRLIKELPSPMYSDGGISRVVVLDDETAETGVKVEAAFRVKIEADTVPNVSAKVDAEFETRKSFSERKKEARKRCVEKETEVYLASIRRLLDVEIESIDEEAEQSRRQILTHASSQSSLVQHIKEEKVAVKIEGASALRRLSYGGAEGVGGVTRTSPLFSRTPSPFPSGSSTSSGAWTSQGTRMSSPGLVQPLARDLTAGIPF